MNDFVDSAQMIMKVFNNLSAQDMEEYGKAQKAWQETVSKISVNGEKLAAHSSVADLKNGILLIESDHPGWNQMLQMHKKFILTGMNRLCGGMKIESLAFKVKGSVASLADPDEIAKRAVEKYAQKIEEEQKQLEDMGFKNQKSDSELPPELKAIFDRIREGQK